MKMRLFLTVVMGFAFAVSAQQLTPKLVEITDMTGNKGFEILDAEGLAELTKQVKEETKIFPLVMVEAKKKWLENDEFKKKHFPSTAVKVRKFRVLKQDKEEVLQKLKEKAEDRMSASQDKKISEQSEKYKKMKKRKGGDEMVAKIQEKEEEKNRLESAAGSLVEQLMGEKLGRAIPSYGTGAFGFDGAFGDKKDDKKEDKKDDKKADAKKGDKKAADAKKPAKKDEKK
ncbi:MAG: hypothetical protein J5985_08070 [Kiritimatiellae bacterium]|nr:hypothetical protein [Kiritimatiellia bacterium]